jgi:AbrB family looped-hinge helix DNA binding protein
MKEMVSTITSKGQVTIPAEIRRHLGVSQGDKLSFVIEDDGSIEVKVATYPTVASLRERGPGLDEDLSYDEMKEIAYIRQPARVRPTRSAAPPRTPPR